MKKQRIKRWLLARLLKKQSRIAKSEDADEYLEQLKQTLDGEIAQNGLDSDCTLLARYLVANQLEEMGRRQEAQMLWETQVETNRRIFGVDDPGTLRIEEYLAVNVFNSNDLARAKDLFVHIFEVRQGTLGLNHEETQWVGRWIESIDEAERTESE